MELTEQQIIENAGLRYLGLQEMPKGKPAEHCFNASSGSTLLMTVGSVTEDTLKIKLDDHAERNRRQ